MSTGNTHVTHAEKRQDSCISVRETLNFVGDKWSTLIVLTLKERALRFNELRNKIDGISQRMLTRNLRNLERNGLINRTVVSTVPPSVYYELTELGISLLDPIDALISWSHTAYPHIKNAQINFDIQNPEPE